MNELTETQKAYLAGFFDGEGCVSISKWQGVNNRTPVYQLQVVIAQKSDVVVDLCQITGLGSVCGKADKKYMVNYLQWRLSPHEGVELLEAILPYLRNKAQEAEIAIEFQSKQGHKNNTKGRGWTVPQEMIDEKEKYYQTMRELKGTSGGYGDPETGHTGRGKPRKQK